MEYQSFSMQDFETDGEPLLTKIDYLTDMFDLEVQNEQGQPIVITLREKQSHLKDRQERAQHQVLAKAGMSRFPVNDPIIPPRNIRPGSFYCQGCQRVVRMRHRCPGPRIRG